MAFAMTVNIPSSFKIALSNFHPWLAGIFVGNFQEKLSEPLCMASGL